MQLALSRAWWSIVIRGVVAILFGLLTLAWPGITLGALVLLFAFYAFVDGVVNIAGAWHALRARERWGVLFIEGIAGIAAGLFTVAWPAITAIILVYIVAAWAVVTGVLEISAAIRLRKFIAHEWLLVLAGIASVVFGFALMLYPLMGALVLAIWIGVYALIFGGMLVGLGFRLRTWHKALGGPTPAISIP